MNAPSNAARECGEPDIHTFTLSGQLHQGVAPLVSKLQALRDHPLMEPASLQRYPDIHYPLPSCSSKAVCGVSELTVLYTRPCGVPSLGREPEKRRFALSLSAHLRRQVQPHHRLCVEHLAGPSRSGTVYLIPYLLFVFNCCRGIKYTVPDLLLDGEALSRRLGASQGVIGS